MTLVLPVAAASDGGSWRRHGGALLLVAALLVALFAGDAAAVADTWWTSTTFGHCLLVPPVVAWLVWERRRELARLTPAAWWPGLAVVSAGAALWLVGQAGAVTAARQFGLFAMLAGAVVALLGATVARGLAFPLGYLFLAVPFGEWLEAPLQVVTVRLCLPLLALVGLPATSNGVMVHAGRYWFEVAEACSGAKFVIAMVAVGVLVARLCFRRWPRRLAFMVACVVVPVLANGLRAAVTMWVANRTSVEAAAGFDHIVYGWLWFAGVMAAVLAIGWRWFDRPAGERAFDPARLGAPLRPAPLVATAAATLAIPALFALWGAASVARVTPPAAALALPAVPGWRLVPVADRVAWRPFYPAADHRLIARYVDAAGEPVDVAVAVFDGQAPGRSVVAYGTGAIGGRGDEWARVAAGRRHGPHQRRPRDADRRARAGGADRHHPLPDRRTRDRQPGRRQAADLARAPARRVAASGGGAPVGPGRARARSRRRDRPAGRRAARRPAGGAAPEHFPTTLHTVIALRAPAARRGAFGPAQRCSSVTMPQHRALLAPRAEPKSPPCR